MPQCAIRSCKNNYRNINVSLGVSYFRFPHDPITCAEWISIVARERGETFYKPAKTSVICSDHFDKSDLSGNTLTRRRLVRTAIPKLQLGPSSSQVSNLSQKYGSPYQSAVSCVYGSGSGAESPLPEHTAPSGDGKHTQLKQQVKRKRSGDPAARQPESLACSECGSRVAARVYVCVQCVDARMCAACEPHAHASHAVVRLPSTRVYNIVRDLFESLQAQLNCRLRGLDDDAEDELTDDIDDDELDQYIDLPAVKKAKPPVIAPSTSQEIIPPVASKVTSKTSLPASPTPTEETEEPMVMADAIKVEEQDPLRETAAEGFVRITSDIVKSERGEETVAEPNLAQVVRAADDTYIEINVPKSSVNESKLKIVNTTKGKSVGSNVTVVRKPKGKTAGNNVPVARKPTGNTTGSNVTGVRKTAGGNVIGNTSIERAQANKSGSEITMEIKQEPSEDACTEEVDSTGFIVFGSHRSIEGKNKKTS
ncbi:uncharacterized protein LOC105381188 isoform X5 [Plutella xylostella]|uniref:uncharacterized protein LOC105381188 isoform X5 n=1 Tax=Plutella xylostella TaxID=51655 RepID=UPI0020328254|nr:uncharacterized protein LOC105381188 isoform X5 [Plutella xylostella]